MTAKDLRVSGAVEGLENRSVIVQLGERGIESNEEGIVDTRVTNIVTNGGD